MLGSTSFKIAMAGAALLLASTAAPVVGASAAPTHTYYGQVSVSRQATEGNLRNVVNGDQLKAGYAFTELGNHGANTLTFYFPPGPPDAFDFPYTCSSGGGSGHIYVEPPNAVYQQPAGSHSWYPSAQQSDPATYQGSTTLATSCTGPIDLSKGATFTTCVTEQTTDTSPDKVNVRWHYSVNGSAGSWSSPVSVPFTTSPYAAGCGGASTAAGSGTGASASAPADQASTAPASHSGGALAFTGAQIALMTVFGLAVIGSGAVLVMASRRRKRATSPA